MGAAKDWDGQRVMWTAATQAAPSFNRLQQMSRTISELQAEVALWKRSSQVSHLTLHLWTLTLKSCTNANNRASAAQCSLLCYECPEFLI